MSIRERLYRGGWEAEVPESGRSDEYGRFGDAHQLDDYGRPFDPTRASRVPGKTTRTSLLPLQRKVDVNVTAVSDEVPTPTVTGRPLEPGVRRDMEAAFAADFGAVRLQESDLPGRVGAVAFAQGDEVHFAPGAYQPHTPSGRELLAHELTHVVQQRQGRVTALQGKGVASDAALEQEADRIGAQVAARFSSGDARAPVGAVTPAVSRRQLKSKNLSVQVATDNSKVVAIHFAGRSDSPFGDTMGSHTTAWMVHCDHVRGVLFGCTMRDAFGRLADLHGEITQLPAYGWTKDDLKKKLDAAMTELDNEINRGNALVTGKKSPAQILSCLQEAIGCYLTARNYVSCATVKAGRAVGHAEASARRRLTELARFDREDQTQGRIADVRHAIWELFDFVAVATTIDAALTATLDDRLGDLLGQHLFEVREAYPQSFQAALFDRNNLEQLIDEGSKAADKAAGKPLNLTKATIAAKALVHAQKPPSKHHAAVASSWSTAKALERRAMFPANAVAESLAKDGVAKGTLDAAAVDQWKKVAIASAMMESFGPPDAKGVGSAPKVGDVATVLMKTVAQAATDAKNLFGARTPDEPTLLAVFTGAYATAVGDAKKQLATFPMSAFPPNDINELQKITSDAGRGDTAASLATASLSGKQQSAAQIMVNDKDEITDFHAARPESPFTNMGAHTTAWVVHEDAIKTAVVGKDPQAALQNLMNLGGPLVGTGAKPPVLDMNANFGPLVRPQFDAAIEELKASLEAAKAAKAAKSASLELLQTLAQRILQVENLLPLATLDVSSDRGGKSERSLSKMKAEVEKAAEDATERRRAASKDWTLPAVDPDYATLDKTLAVQIWKNFDLGQVIHYAQSDPKQNDLANEVSGLVASGVVTSVDANNWDDTQKTAAYWDVHAPGTGKSDMLERIAVTLSQHRFYIEHAYPWLHEGKKGGNGRLFPSAHRAIHTVDGVLEQLVPLRLTISLATLLDKMNALFPFPGYDSNVAAKTATAQQKALEKREAKEMGVSAKQIANLQARVPSSRKRKAPTNTDFEYDDE